MRYWQCLTCHRKIETLLNETLLKCSCGTYEQHLLIEVDKKGFPIRKEVKE